MQAYLELKGITKRFGKLTANNNIDLQVEKGTVHAIIGENGAGKSTLMNIISGIYQQDDGEVLIGGKVMRFRNATDANRAGVGMVYQEFMLFPEMSVLDNIMMGYEKLTVCGVIHRKKTRKAVEEICKTYGFDLPLDAMVSELPVSVLQQVEIVKILYRGAEILIFDEPTSVLTPQGVEGLFEAMRFLIQKGKTILFITHKLHEVLEIADRITVLKDGCVTGNTVPKETSKEKLASMMVGRTVVLEAEKLEKTAGDEVLHVEHLTVADERQRLRVKDVALSVRAGEIVGIAGVAGSGQVELVESLFGLQKQLKGKVAFCGNDISNATCRERRCMGIGYVPQDRMADGVNRDASIWENCMMGYHVAHGFHSKLLIDHKQAYGFADDVVEKYAVKTPSLQTHISSLSGGNVQKTIVGREFLQDNKLLIIQDPTRGIDIGAIEFIWKKIELLAASGVAVLLVSQELNEVMEVSDRILVMYDGGLYDAGRHGELTEQQIGLLMTGGGRHEA